MRTPSFSFAQVETLEPLQFWYACVSVAHNGYNETDNNNTQLTDLNVIVDGLHLGYQFNPYLITEVEYQFTQSLSEITTGDADHHLATEGVS
ncbi:hypothetical protein HWQ46_26310 [Shewanella sp. D64]|uniref:hypothetical protein n=1 Tax=unclassified Shewanella TaxID=196818 RepID=UPI0022BA1FBF|nr:MULTISPECIES: hypothetical protein [unclassified Shewanella]MEC4729030.1 hypothetical protein [Shewanella sp. D64]MEC4739895.1 hypothetical protein [Shewanella sp. E94]WBJ97139.1 hypothetical protein HWQ47_08560 [Shewanella sp. MTB7]